MIDFKYWLLVHWERERHCSCVVAVMVSSFLCTPSHCKTALRSWWVIKRVTWHQVALFFLKKGRREMQAFQASQKTIWPPRSSVPWATLAPRHLISSLSLNMTCKPFFWGKDIPPAWKSQSSNCRQIQMLTGWESKFQTRVCLFFLS